MNFPWPLQKKGNTLSIIMIVRWNAELAIQKRHDGIFREGSTQADKQMKKYQANLIENE